MVFWVDLKNTDTDYIADFDTKEKAINYVEEHRKHFERQAINFKGTDDIAVDMDIEEWECDELDEYEPINEIGIVYSIQLWERPISYYRRKQASVRQQAIDYQLRASNQNLSYYELMKSTNHFAELGKRYGLLREFKENGII